MLPLEQQSKLLDLFQQSELLFDGTLGCVPNIKVHLELQDGAKPYCSCQYRILHLIYEIAKGEVKELVDVGVLIPDIYSKWGAPCLFRPKKDGGVCFLSDLCKLNA